MTISSFNSFKAFNKALISINKSLESERSNILTGELKIEKKGSISYTLKVIWLSLSRLFANDPLSSLKVNSIISKLSDEVYFYSGKKVMTKEAKTLIRSITTQLDIRTKRKYAEIISIFSRNMNDPSKLKKDLENEESESEETKQPKRKTVKGNKTIIDPKKIEKKTSDKTEKTDSSSYESLSSSEESGEEEESESTSSESKDSKKTITPKKHPGQIANEIKKSVKKSEESSEDSNFEGFNRTNSFGFGDGQGSLF